MRERWGRIINISSVVGEMGNPGQANYVASKAGLIGLTKALAQEMGSRNITVNAVAPGFIETDMTQKLSQELKDNLVGHVALKRIGQPEDVAAAVCFLASEEARYITGHVLNVNGGLTVLTAPVQICKATMRGLDLERGKIPCRPGADELRARPEREPGESPVADSRGGGRRRADRLPAGAFPFAIFLPRRERRTVCAGRAHPRADHGNARATWRASSRSSSLLRSLSAAAQGSITTPRP